MAGSPHQPRHGLRHLIKLVVSHLSAAILHGLPFAHTDWDWIGAVAEVLEVHAAEARALRRARREMAARTVGVRSVLPLVCCFLPAFILVGVVPIIAATLGSFTQLR